MLSLVANEYQTARSLLLPPLRGVSRRDDKSLGRHNSGSFLEALQGICRMNSVRFLTRYSTVAAEELER
jgi:hypothetical protein